MCICLSVQATTLGTAKASFLACRYILTISRSSLSIKVIDQGQMYFFVTFYQNCQFHVFLFHSNMIKCQGHLKVKVKPAQY